VSRSVFRYHAWTLTSLTAEDGHPPAYAAVCDRPTCNEESEGYKTPEEAELWTLRHAAELGDDGEYHTVFRMVIESRAVARPALKTPSR
jgi:hypothetical protein